MPLEALEGSVGAYERAEFRAAQCKAVKDRKKPQPLELMPEDSTREF